MYSVYIKQRQFIDIKVQLCIKKFYTGTGGPTFFFTKSNIGSYMKALSINYIAFFIEYRKI